MSGQKGNADARVRPGTPAWVKVLGTAIVVAILAIVVVNLIAGGQHGPGMHVPSGTGVPASSSRGSGPASEVEGPVDASDATRTVEVSTLDTMAFEPSAIDVSAGETVHLRGWQLGEAGILEYACHEASHYEAGMRGRMVVG